LRARNSKVEGAADVVPIDGGLCSTTAPKSVWLISAANTLAGCSSRKSDDRTFQFYSYASLAGDDLNIFGQSAGQTSKQ